MKNLKVILIALIVILFGTFVWPTVYRYDKLVGKYPVRINRFTGYAEILGFGGWSKLEPHKPDPSGMN